MIDWLIVSFYKTMRGHYTGWCYGVVLSWDMVFWDSGNIHPVIFLPTCLDIFIPPPKLPQASMFSTRFTLSLHWYIHLARGPLYTGKKERGKGVRDCQEGGTKERGTNGVWTSSKSRWIEGQCGHLHRNNPRTLSDYSNGILLWQRLWSKLCSHTISRGILVKPGFVSLSFAQISQVAILGPLYFPFSLAEVVGNIWVQVYFPPYISSYRMWLWFPDLIMDGKWYPSPYFFLLIRGYERESNGGFFSAYNLFPWPKGC